jgi:CubicO group peptidase (beta-lactamase class C family)
MTSSRVLALAALLCLGAGQDADRLAPPAQSQSAAPPAASAPATPPAPAEAHELSKADTDAWLDGFMPLALKDGDIAGGEVAVVSDGKVLTMRGYGYADIASKTPVDPDKTLFRPGSVSKLVTWTAVMQLVEQGKLDLDADVNGYLDFTIPPYEGRPVTLRQIMTHTSGFEEAAKDLIYRAPMAPMGIADYLKQWVPERIYAPGATPAYSNWATTLAGYIVQRVSGSSFDDYVEQHVFAPLGMTGSTFRQPLPDRLASQMATGYPRASAPAGTFEIVNPSPAGALSSTAGDMARFMIAHLQGGELDGQRILQPATAAMMHDSPLDKVDPYSLLPPLSRMELGFFETNINGREVIGHLGDTEDFHTILHLFMHEGVGLYASFNSIGKDGAVEALREQLFEGFANRYFPAAEVDGQTPADVAARHARMMAGQWRNSRRAESDFIALTSMLGQTTIGLDADGGLSVSGIHDPDGATRRWVEIAPFVWRDAHGHDRLAAKVVDGQVVRWSWELVAPFMVYDRVPATQSSAWIIPAAAASLGFLTLSVLCWPVGRVLRWKYAAPPRLSGGALASYRATQAVIGLTVLLAIGWGVAIATLLSDTSSLNKAFDPVLWTLQIGGLVILVSALFVAGWNVLMTWRTGRTRLARVWSVLVVLAVLQIAWFAYVCGLLTMTVNY